MSIDADQQWFEALAGRKQGEVASVADVACAADVLEGLALRRAIVATLQAEPEAADQSQQRTGIMADPLTEPRIDVDRESALIARARAQGLLSPDRPTSLAPPRAVRGLSGPGMLPRFAVAAALLVAVGAGVWRSRQEPNTAVQSPPSDMVRAGTNGTVRLRDRDPGALQLQLEQELGAAGVHVTRFTRLGRLGIDADLPVPVPAAIAAILEHHHVPIPRDGVLSVEIDAAGP